MTRKKALVVGGGALAALLMLGGGLAATQANDDDDKPLTGDTYDRAVEAALAHTGGGTVTETEFGDDGAVYSVEVQRADGTQVEVNLDSDFKVIGSEPDEDTPGEEDD